MVAPFLFLAMNVALFGVWVYAVVDCAREQRNYVWLAIAAAAPLTFYASAFLYLANFKLLPAIGKRPIDDVIRAARKLREVSARVADRGLCADYLELSTILFEEQKWSECLAAVKHVLELEDDNIQAHYQAGVCLLRLSKPEQAAVHLSFVCDERADFADGEAAARLAETYFLLGHDKDAESALRAALKSHPMPEASVQLARILLARKDRDGAAQILRRFTDAPAAEADWYKRKHRRWLKEADETLRSLGSAE